MIKRTAPTPILEHHGCFVQNKILKKLKLSKFNLWVFIQPTYTLKRDYVVVNKHSCIP